MPSSKRAIKFDAGDSPPAPTLARVAAKAASPSVIRQPGRHLMASMRSRTHTRLVAAEAAALLPPPPLPLPHIPTPALPAAPPRRWEVGSEDPCTSCCPLLPAAAAEVVVVRTYFPAESLLPLSCLPLPPADTVAAADALVARRGDPRCAEPRLGLFRPPLLPAATYRVDDDDDATGLPTRAPPPPPRAGDADAAPEAAEGAGDARDGEAGAAVVDGQVEAGDSNA